MPFWIPSFLFFFILKVITIEKVKIYLAFHTKQFVHLCYIVIPRISHHDPTSHSHERFFFFMNGILWWRRRSDLPPSEATVSVAFLVMVLVQHHKYEWPWKNCKTRERRRKKTWKTNKSQEGNLEYSTVCIIVRNK